MSLEIEYISRSIYSVSIHARRLIAMASALLPEKEGDYKVSFNVRDLIGSLGITWGGEQKKYLRAAVEEALGATIKINMPNGDWVGYTWFTECRLTNFRLEVEWGWGTIHMEFNPKLGEALKKLKGFATLNLMDLGKLQSRYAIRFYEIALSYAGFAGKDGNRRGEWYFDMTLQDIRIRFDISPNKYKLTKDFRVYIIDNSIEEINNARIGLWIEPEYQRSGRYLAGVRFKCRWIKRDEPLPGWS
jgi:hypothetical protein